MDEEAAARGYETPLDASSPRCDARGGSHSDGGRSSDGPLCYGLPYEDGSALPELREVRRQVDCLLARQLQYTGGYLDLLPLLLHLLAILLICSKCASCSRDARRGVFAGCIPRAIFAGRIPLAQ